MLKSPTADALETICNRPLDPNGAKEPSRKGEGVQKSSRLLDPNGAREPNRKGEGVREKRNVLKAAGSAEEPNRLDREQDQPREKAGLHNKED